MFTVIDNGVAVVVIKVAIVSAEAVVCVIVAAVVVAAVADMVASVVAASRCLLLTLAVFVEQSNVVVGGIVNEVY